MVYRRDIDGLRALAIGMTLLFHAKLGVHGGYVGVDIFFVLSGFLITGQILEQQRAGTFSLADFYLRRIRRILPILFTVMLATLAGGAVFLLIDDYSFLGRSTIAALGFVMNVALWRSRQNYFAPYIEENPLVHLWSLSVEEQFYLVFPILLLLLWRFWSKRTGVVLLALAMGSLLAAAYVLKREPLMAFYFLPFRFWELLLGGLLHFLPPFALKRVGREGLAALGMGALIFCATQYGSRTAFPGFAALLPTVGTALILWSGTGRPTWVSRILSLPPFVGLGLISYGLYLWHWPILVYANMAAPLGLSLGAKLALLAGATLLSYLSWRFIETPWRRREVFPRASHALMSLGLITVGIGLWANSARVPGGLLYERHIARFREPEAPSVPDLPMECIDRICQDPAVKVPPQRVLWGDSHARHFMYGSHQYDPAIGYLFHSGCPPLLGAYPQYIYQVPRTACDSEVALRLLEAATSVKQVILSGRWQNYVAPTDNLSDLKGFGVASLCENGHCSRKLVERRDIFRRGLSRSLSRLRQAGKEVILIGPTPNVAFHVQRAFNIATWLPIDIPLYQESLQPESYEYVLGVLKDLAREYQVELKLPHEVLCTPRCRTSQDDRSLYQDDHHLSIYGGAVVWRALFAPERAVGSQAPSSPLRSK